jgi:hypothetical protein
MALAEIGPFTTLMQNVAAGVGAGMLLGAFATGVVGLASAWPRRHLERLVTRHGYAGGLGGILVMLADITLRYGG